MSLRRLGTPLLGMLEVFHCHSKLHTSVPLSYLTSALIRRSPMELEQENKRRSRGKDSGYYDPSAADGELHELIQREFTGARLKNVSNFKDFLKESVLYEKKPFSLPPINLFIDGHVDVDILDDNQVWRPLDSNDRGSVGIARIFIDPADRTVAVDGETQVAAFFELLYDVKDNPKELAIAKKIAVAIGANFEAPVEWAKRAFVLHNSRGVQVTKSQSFSLDTDNPLLSIVNSIVVQRGWEDHVSDKHRQGNKEKPLTVAALMNYVESIYLGTFTGKPLQNGIDIEVLHHKAVEWMNDLYSALGDRLIDYNSFCSSSLGIAALGIVGHTAMELPVRDRRPILTRIGEVIDWSNKNLANERFGSYARTSGPARAKAIAMHILNPGLPGIVDVAQSKTVAAE